LDRHGKRIWIGGLVRNLVPFNEAAEFARYLVESYERGDTSDFPAAFATLETILNEGDQEARNIAGIGVIEDLQTIGSNHSCGAEVFLTWLGPLSQVAWAQVEKMWEGKESLMDVLRAKTLAREED
jgi:hypothetical protein